VQVSVVLHGGAEILSGMKGLLACFLGRLRGPSFGLGDFGNGFGVGSNGRCRVGLLVDGHVGSMVVAMGVEGGYESE
jgi:hypothetical protein